MRNTLFSDYYLERLYPEDARYQEAGDRIAEATARIAPLFDGVDDWAADAAEAELEDRLIRPVLRVLGYPYVVQTPLRQAGSEPPTTSCSLRRSRSASPKGTARLRRVTRTQ